ncbi:helix-turn-helix domain-containing protein [Agrobacterium larrymoorei]|uniref:AraC-like DNA-binding protein n=1 Tax=Agrobacterium larrymoorei TaxID=160699 RepID=A0ABU0UKJ1_9HYPH|nr:AraC family transcriptional regulator [Agrobacterium larrymoorei]MDQ1185358.1 AraC-like DNA-binding protein [Agrobacterium larrymoorei]
MARHQFTMPKTTMPGVAAVIADSDRSFPRHMHDQFGIGVIERGAQKSASGRGVVEAEAGRVITVNPGEVHDGIALSERGRAWTMLYLDPEVVHAALSDIREHDNRDFEFVYPVDPRPLADRFRAVFQTMMSQRSALPGEEALLLLLSQMLERPLAMPKHAASVALSRVREMVDEAPQMQFSLAELAAEAGMSRFRFLRAFSSVTGLTPHSYLMQRRLHMARQALAKGDAPAEAALASGFCDQSHLNRVFVRHFGTTPAVYRHALS